MSIQSSLNVEIETHVATNSTSHAEAKDRTEKSKDNEKTNSVLFYKLFLFADFTDFFFMLVDTMGAVCNGLGLPLMTVLIGQLIGSFGTNQHNKNVVHLVSKISLKFIYPAVFTEVTFWMVTGERQAARIRVLYLRIILRQDIAFFNKETTTGEVVGRMSGDTILIQDAKGEKVGKFIQLMSTFIGGFIIAFTKGWLLTLVTLSIIPPLVVSGALMSLIIGKMASQGQSAYAKAADVVEQTIGSIRTFLVDAYKSGVCKGMAAGLGLATGFFIIFYSFALATWFGGKMILEKGYAGVQVLNVLVAVLTDSMSLGEASPCMTAFAVGQATGFKMFKTINRKPEINSRDTRGKTLDEIRGDIELRDVYFSYPARPDELTFNGFSLYIPSGTTAALVGQSGSRKSTVISLIERFYDPQAGEVLIDGINLKDHEPVLFASSIKDNIAYGKENATIEEIRAAAQLANAAKFIDKLPKGLDTMVGEYGTQLSGGQKQRVAIARAILKDPRILLLDEATSALNAESERIVQEALDRIMGNGTTIIVAHRLSTVRNTDMIAVIHGGKIVERGTHLELQKDPDGAYGQLICLQQVNTEQDQAIDYQNKPEYLLDARQSSQRMSFLRTINRGSSGVGNSSCHSLSISFVLPMELNIPNGAPANPESTSLEKTETAAEVSIHRLAYLNKPEVPVLLIGSIFAIIAGVVFPIFGILLSSVVKTFYEEPHKLRKDSKPWALMFVTLDLVSLVAHPARTYFFSIAGCRLIQRIRSICFEKVVHMEVGWFDEPEHSSSVIGARLSADAATVQALVGDALAQLVQNSATAVAGLIIAFATSWQLAFIILGLLPLIFVNGFVQVKFMKGFSADTKMMYQEASQVATHAVRSIRTVAFFCSEEKIMQLYAKKCEGGVRFGLSFFLLFAVYGTCFYAGARFVQDRKTTFSEVFHVFFALTMAATAITQSSSLTQDSTKARSATALVFEIIDRKLKVDPSDGSGETLKYVKGEIELHEISFKYPSRPDIQIFKDLSLTIHSGKTVALVGESRSGKSTVIALLQRFYDPDSGHITLDGIEIQKLQLKWFRQQMGLVRQELVLYNDTIHANIACGKDGEATEAETLTASELANAHKFISSLQQGYDTLVGERGVQLSGGQKQRMAIASCYSEGSKDTSPPRGY
ncbi:hypothetical protein NL676_000508 [Syzygium grande]|nr:hypothetical protein NL676_000508 [Syzygium grande]